MSDTAKVLLSLVLWMLMAVMIGIYESSLSPFTAMILAIPAGLVAAAYLFKS
jgi:hypothetical protein